MCFEGNIDEISKDNQVPIHLKIIMGDGTNIDCDALIDLQGASTVKYPKKNYNIRLFKTGTEESLKIELYPGWGKHDKYTIKANWDDPSQARNIVSGRLFNEVVQSRNKNDKLELAPNGGVVDGFPIELYINDIYSGLYTFNIPKSKWMFGMDDKGKEAILHAISFSSSCRLEEPIGDDYSLDWQLKYCSTGDDSEWVIDSFNDMIVFLNSSSDSEFIEHINEYVDVDRTIDAMIFSFFIDYYDGLVHNINWVTYDGKHWIPSPYDIEVTWGLFLQDVNDPIELYVTPEDLLFGCSDELLLGADDWTISRMNQYCIGNLLYRRLYTNFYDDIKIRYIELRKSVLSLNNIENNFSNFFSQIPSYYYDEDKVLYPERNYDGQEYESIIEYAEKRGIFLDEYFGE